MTHKINFNFTQPVFKYNGTKNSKISQLNIALFAERLIWYRVVM